MDKVSQIKIQFFDCDSNVMWLDAQAGVRALGRLVEPRIKTNIIQVGFPRNTYLFLPRLK